MGLKEKIKSNERLKKLVHWSILIPKQTRPRLWIKWFVNPFYNKKRNYQKALYYINKALNIDSENVIYWKLYSQINLRLNHFEEAERGFKRTLELGNYELSTWLSRGDLLIKIGEPEAAIYNFEQAIEYFPNSPNAYDSMADYYESQNDNPNAIKYVSKAYNLSGNDVYKQRLEKLQAKK